ncbi:hypothetical protein BXZ70DRAFT_664091 [Cristinia sonorae]|uniref:Uncharacterized protein n=1 Tax=Cristinia sonorae TaxID=1940300 RepID=A0A8K0XSI3_9AGAR|nr:hypothetical protein BXZ70DRAFT_664091 [Cristinia sonorae]
MSSKPFSHPPTSDLIALINIFDLAGSQHNVLKLVRWSDSLHQKTASGNPRYKTRRTSQVRTEETLFRVYSSILHSPVFRGLFTLPQPLNGEAYDGHPVVSLQDGTEELVVILTVLHRWSYLRDLSNDSKYLLRVSRKNDVTKVRARTINALKRHYPPPLTRHDKLSFHGAQVLYSVAPCLSFRQTFTMQTCKNGRSLIGEAGHDNQGQPRVSPISFYQA